MIWAASPVFTGELEPWDGSMGYYALALALAGFLAALILPRRFWLAPVGVYLGQVAYLLLFLPKGPLMVVGLVFLVGYSLLALGGSALAYLLWRMRPIT